MDGIMKQAIGAAKHFRRNITRCTLVACADMAVTMLSTLGIKATVPKQCKALVGGGNSSTVATPSHAITPAIGTAMGSSHNVTAGGGGVNDTSHETAHGARIAANQPPSSSARP